jgi:hypothetical protein
MSVSSAFPRWRARMTAIAVGAAAAGSMLAAASVAHGQVCVAEDPCGDMNASGTVTASDALGVLRRSVDLPGELQCRCMDAEAACPQISGSYAGTALVLITNCAMAGEERKTLTPFEVATDGCRFFGGTLIESEGDFTAITVGGTVADDGELAGEFRLFSVSTPAEGSLVQGTLGGAFADDAISLLIFAEGEVNDGCSYTLDVELER